jgi:hypothetical protein
MGMSENTQTKIEVSIPDTIHLSQADIDAMTAQFNAKLVELIKNRGGGGGAQLKPVLKGVSVEKVESVDVN